MNKFKILTKRSEKNRKYRVSLYRSIYIFEIVYAKHTSARFLSSSLMALLRLDPSQELGILIELDNDECGSLENDIGGGGGGIVIVSSVAPRCTSTVTVLVSIFLETKQISAIFVLLSLSALLVSGCWPVDMFTRMLFLDVLLVWLFSLIVTLFPPVQFSTCTVVERLFSCFEFLLLFRIGTIVLLMTVPVSDNLMMVVLLLFSIALLPLPFGIVRISGVAVGIVRYDSGTIGGSTIWSRSFRRSKSLRSQFFGLICPILRAGKMIVHLY